MEPEAKENEHQQRTAESQPETLTSEYVGGRERSHSGQEKEYPPQPRLRRWEVVSSGLQILFNFLVMLFTGGLFYLTFGQLEVAREATEATKRAADAAIVAAQVAQRQLEEMKGSSADTKAVADAAKAQALNTEKLAIVTQEQIEMMRGIVAAAERSARTADQTLVLTHRPWVVVTHQMFEPSKPLVPLNFVKDHTGSVSAWLSLNEVLENIGHSVALDVVSWSEVIPGVEPGFQRVLARRERYCDELRYPNAKTSPGLVLFPQHKYPPEGKLLVTKDRAVRRAISLMDAQLNEWQVDLKGRTDFAVIGCISYRASFEAVDARRHQTRFMYVLGYPKKGRVFAALKPFAPVPDDVGLVLIPEATIAD